MKRLALWLVPAALLAGETRYARLGEIEGRPEVQPQAADAWQPALRNTLLLDGMWLRTGAGSRAEVELDEGSVFRLDSEALGELSDYTRLSTGQRVTLLSLDRGVAYFTGAPEGRDTLMLAVPGAQATLRRGTRLRLEARETWSQIAVIEGSVLFSSPAAELEIKEGQMVRVEPTNTERFFLYGEITALESDQWSERRDKALVSTSGGHIAAPRYGLPDLDSSGKWLETAAWGTVWKPKIAAGWAPFRSGRWTWYDSIGYTWVSDEPWGWLPYHYGRWALDETNGWVWVPGKDAVFSPGDVYWLRGAKLAGWGPLAPGEEWNSRARPQLYLISNTTFGAFAPEMREIDPAGFTAPKEPLAVASFAAALPSPALPAARLEARRPVLRAGSTRVTPQLNGVTFEQASGAGTAGGVSASEVAAAAQAPAPYVNTTVVQAAPQPPVVVITPPPEPVEESYYPAPVYTGIVVVNPPERDSGGGRDRGRSQGGTTPQPASQHPKPVEQQPKPAEPPKTTPQPAPVPQPAPTPPAPAPTALPRTEAAQPRAERPPDPPKPAPPADKPIPRNTDQVSKGDTARGEADARRRADPK